ncbi:MAG: bifunctional aconitate hydratase 2/2-methylisocitrate dehydratase [Candidatus Thioglobus sp.]|uniref:bifunctional aconitate hydratase 2/2-methylisocitrate dehydratase n=1 Tax=Candidatus Thioglobus sp. TaxID=2026721 RepID=UPI0030B00BB4
MKSAYLQHVSERQQNNLPPLALNAEQVASVVQHLIQGDEDEFYLDLLTNRVPPGVDEAAYVKAGFLASVAKGDQQCNAIDQKQATFLLGTMIGGYNIAPMVDLLDNNVLAPIAAEGLSHTLLMFDAFYDVKEKADAGNLLAQKVLQSWADAEWFTSREKVSEKISTTIFKVTGETNTDDLSPAPDAWSRPDIPLHSLSMLKMTRDGVSPEEHGKIGPISQIQSLQEKGFPLAYVGDVVGTGSSRKSATNSVLWFMGNDIAYVPNKKDGGVCLGGKIAPIFFNTMQDSGALPIELDVTQLKMGDVIDIYPYEGVVKKHNTDEVLSTFELKSSVILDEVQAGGRIPLIIGRGLTARAREALELEPSKLFRLPVEIQDTGKGYSLAQKMVGKACGVEGIRPGTYCEPKMTTVGSQDTTGPMTRDELKDLACLGFSADLTMQSFCHTAAYPKPVDVETHHTLPDFMMNRGGVSLRPGDGIIHSWLNRMLLPDTVGTGGDSHTRFPIGISFPAGSGLVAFAAATGVMPLDMPESVLVRFSGEMQPGITLRDMVNAIPLKAIEKGLLTVAKEGKVNAFSGRVLEIEGLPNLKVEQAFELSDSAAERSAAGCSIHLDKAPIIEYLTSNVVMLKWMIAQGYGDKRTIARRIQAMEKWMANPELMKADDDADYAEVIEINMSDIKEPILACPNDPDDVKTLSDVANTKIDEVFIGSCMTNIGHFRAAAQLLKNKTELNTELWIAPPTRMDEKQLKKEGVYDTFTAITDHTEMPGCSLCMGNQARVKTNATVVSTSTRNFPNRLGDEANVYLSSAEVAAISAKLGYIPTAQEYLSEMKDIEPMEAQIYQYLNFDQIGEYEDQADTVPVENILSS